VKRSSRALATAIAALLTLGSAAGAAAGGGGAGTVYTLTNAASGNAVLAFSRTAKGSLAPLATYPTGGLGSGSGLGSQGAVTISSDGDWLLAVNAGSDQITSFAIGSGGRLTWIDNVASGGDHPISVTEHDGLVYALNDGGAGNIAGFTIDGSGGLSAIAGSSQPLSTSASAPAEIAFNPAGDTLTVSEKGTNRITTYAVGSAGRAAAPTWISSAGTTPFGFAFDAKGRAFVSEAAGGAPNASTISSYAVGDGQAILVDGPAATTESAACWVAVTKNGRFAYTANTGSGTVSGFAVSRGGGLTRLDDDGVTGITGGAPADLAMSGNSHFLYVRTGGINDIVAFRVASNGGLTSIGSTDLPAGTVGIAVR
jgi:6-phosphogluconolactonase (cycloisomerase 2 family)